MRLVRWPPSPGILRLVSSLNWMKRTRKQSCDTWLHASVSRSGWSRLQRRWHRPKVANPTNHFPTQNWQFIIATLSRWLGWFRVKPRAEILHQKRKCIPLPLPINIFYLHGVRGEDQGSKVKKKSSFFRVPSSCSSLCFSLHRGLLLQPPEPPTASPPQENKWWRIG